MKRLLILSGIGILTALLAGWVALANAQNMPVTPPLPDVPVSVPAAVDVGSSGGLPPGAMPPAPVVNVPAPVSVEVPGPVPAPVSVPTPPSMVGTTPPPAVSVPVPAPGTSPRILPAESVRTPEVPTPAPSAGVVPPAPGSVTPPPVGSSSTPSANEETPPAKAFKPAEPVETGAGDDQLTGRQEPAVSLEWMGSPIAKVGQNADYSIVVRNICNVPVQDVTVRVRVPAGLTPLASEPRATAEGGLYVWHLGTLVTKQERVIQLRVKADTKGDVAPKAWVTFTGSSVMRLRVREPKLALKCSVQEKALVGDPAAFTLTVSNPGDGSADQVKIHAVLSEGLEHARGNKIDFEIGSLAPGESRNVTLLCATRTGGVQKCDASAEAEGGMKASDKASLNVIMPRLDLQIVGPRLRYLDRRAIYSLKVTNPGDAPATNVTVADMVPAGFKVLAASDGGRHDFQTRTVSWFLGEIAPGQTREVKLEVQAVNIGEHKHKATAVGARGLRAEADLHCRIEGLAALLVEMVDTEDPIEVNGDTAYEVRITNTGSKTEENIKLVATIPDKMQFKNAQGPARYREEGKQIVFEPLQRLAPRAEALFRINVKALEPGTVRFKINVTSLNLVDPVLKMEATRIYSDAPEIGTGSSSSSGSSSGTTRSKRTPAAVNPTNPIPGTAGSPVMPRVNPPATTGAPEVIGVPETTIPVPPPPGGVIPPPPSGTVPPPPAGIPPLPGGMN